MATMLNPNAIPNGSITKEKIDAAVLTTKQDKLTAGNGISIKDNKIDVTTITESESQPSTHLWVNPSEDAETNVTYNRSQIDALVGAKQDTLQLTVKDNGNIVLANLQGQSKEFMPATPSGDPMHYAYVAAGAEYNDTGVDIVKTAPWANLADDDADKTVIHKAGYWYLNGLGDITNEQMRNIYTNARTSIRYLICFLYSSSSRTSIINGRISFVTIQFTGFAFNSYCESIDAGLSVDTLSNAFNNCRNLKYISSLRGRYLKSSTNAFKSCLQLKFLNIYELTISLDIRDSPNLTCKSILFMIENEVSKSAITITLHADAYARAIANADIVAALEAHPNVSLASA